MFTLARVTKSSGGIVDVDEAVRDTKLGSHMRSHRRRTVTLGGVVAAGDKRYPHFARVVRLGLGDLASDENIRTGGNRILKIALRTTRAPRYVFYS